MSTVEHYGTLFPTAVVGSMPRPDFVREVITGGRREDADRQRELMDRAVAYIVSLQEQAGLDIISDGEWRRASYIGVIAELAHGFSLGEEDGRPWTIVTDELATKNPGFIAEEVRYLKSISKRRIKATLPAPALLGERMWDAKKSAGAYPTRREGVDVVQIDDPHLCLLVDDDVRASYDDADSEAAFSAEMTNAVVEGIEGVRLAVHLCRRAGARVRGEACHTGGYGPIIDYLNQLKVHHLTMEFTAPGAGDAEVFKVLREDFEIGLGCVGVHPGQVDTVEEIVQRVEQALQHLAPERLVLNPDCGFAPGSAARVDIDEVYQKLQNQVEAAQRLREKYA
jgi:5-methyltetrahydropteroyltriglutamate--homocysteine methyltransferase